MFVSSGQIYILIACIAFGGVSGVLFSIAYFVKLLMKNFYIRVVIDILTFAITALVYVVFSFKLSFPNFRFYMVVAVVMGMFIYFKSFGLLLAKLSEKLYNVLRKIFLRKKSKHDGTKGKKSNRCKHGGRSHSCVHSNFRHGVANVQD